MRNGNKQFFFDILCVFTLTLDTGGSHKIISDSDFLKDRIRNRSDHTDPDHRIRFHLHLIFIAMDFSLSIYIDQNQNQSKKSKKKSNSNIWRAKSHCIYSLHQYQTHAACRI